MLLPPSETKREGGAGRFAAGRLSFPVLQPERRVVLDALVGLARDPAEAARALHLGAGQAGEIERNRRLRTAPVLPAIERYAGVVYDGLEPGSLDPAGRSWVEAHVLIGSALFGLVRAGDPIPAYRFSTSAALPGLSLRSHWSPAITRVLRGQRAWVLDARSEAYARLGPPPADAAVLHVEQIGADGRRRALNHFNKLYKGRLVRRLAETSADVGSRAALLAWAAAAGVPLEPRGARDVTLVAP